MGYTRQDAQIPGGNSAAPSTYRAEDAATRFAQNGGFSAVQPGAMVNNGANGQPAPGTAPQEDPLQQLMKQLQAAMQQQQTATTMKEKWQAARQVRMLNKQIKQYKTAAAPIPDGAVASDAHLKRAIAVPGPGETKRQDVREHGEKRKKQLEESREPKKPSATASVRG